MIYIWDFRINSNSHLIIQSVGQLSMLLRQLNSLRFLKVGPLSYTSINCYGRKKLNTEVFSDLSWKQFATPELMKKIIIKPIHMHSRVSQKSLYHRKRVNSKIKSCFSEKKTKVFRRINKVKKWMYSDILKRQMYVTMSMKAYKTIRKMGSFDNYILCTKPKFLDSKYGEYLRELMLRKINDEDFRVPYILGMGKKQKIKHHKKYNFFKDQKRISIPRQYKETFKTFQKRFGATPEQLNEEDYKKYVELQNLKNRLGKQLDPAHPLLLELREKMSEKQSPQQEQKLRQMAEQAQRKFLEMPDHRDVRKYQVEKAKKELEIMKNKVRELTMSLEDSDT